MATTPHVIRRDKTKNSSTSNLKKINRNDRCLNCKELGLQGLSEACDNQRSTGKRLFWGLLWFAMLCCCLGQCIICLIDFISGAINTNIFFYKNNTIMAPRVTFCLYDKRERRPVIWKPFLNELYGNVDYSHVYDLLIMTNMSMSTLWSLSRFFVENATSYLWQSSIPEEINPHKLTKMAIVTTANGDCVTYKPLFDMPCTGHQAKLRLSGYGNASQKDYWVIFHTEAETPLLRYYGPNLNGLYLQYNQHVSVALTLKEERYVSSWSNPCTSAEQYYQCEADCFESMIRTESNLTTLCRLPFMKEDSLLLCSNAEEIYAMYKAVDAATEKMLDQNDHCNCPLPCKAYVFVEDYVYEIPNEKYLYDLSISFPKCLVRVIDRTYAYKTANFISDVGGTLGICLGMSVLNIIALFEALIVKFPR